MSIKILLLRARTPEDPMKDHEWRCFVTHSGLEPDQIVPFDLFEGPPSWSHVQGFDALTVGGAGEYYVSKANLPGFDEFLDLLLRVADDGFPTYASCFGYQSMVCALGGSIVYDPERTEVGTYELTLSEAGRRDELFGVLPERFNAQMGHKDRAVWHPRGIPTLASSERCPLQALRIPDKPVWASQFHPELDRSANLERFRYYLEGYATYMTPAERDAKLETFLESPAACELLPRFLDLVFGPDR